jgi:hypothetical protein
MANEHDGRSYAIFRLEKTAFAKAQDPYRSGACVDGQVAEVNGGFAADHIAARPDEATLQQLDSPTPEERARAAAAVGFNAG